MSRPIIGELASVLREKFAWPDSRLLPKLKLLAKKADLIVPDVTINAITTDADDNRILECAVAGRVHLIVSNDHHLLELKAFSGIPVVTPKEFRRILGA